MSVVRPSDTKLRFFHGARVLAQCALTVAPTQYEAPKTDNTRSVAYALARANQHKTWARRWLKQNGYWL